MLLESTVSGYATCPVTHLTELAQGRAILRSLIGHPAVPQVLIRVGQAPAGEQLPPSTGRRPVEDILTFEHC